MAASDFPSAGQTSPRSDEPSLWLWGAALASLVALAGSLYLSIGMGLKACPLCLYQRTFVMGVVGVLTVGLFIKDLRPGALSLLALPPAIAAVAVAGFHCYLEYTGFLECPRGVLGIASAPQQSLVVLVVLVLLLLADQLAQGALAGSAGTIVLGGLFAFGCIRSAPPAPAPERPYAVDLNEDGCRRPFVGNPAP